MDAIITVLAILLIIAARLAWFQTGRIVELKAENKSAQAEINRLSAHAACAQAEIRALEDKLVRLQCQNGLTPGVEP